MCCHGNVFYLIWLWVCLFIKLIIGELINKFWCRRTPGEKAEHRKRWFSAAWSPDWGHATALWVELKGTLTLWKLSARQCFQIIKSLWSTQKHQRQKLSYILLVPAGRVQVNRWSDRYYRWHTQCSYGQLHTTGLFLCLLTGDYTSIVGLNAAACEVTLAELSVFTERGLWICSV